MSGRIKRALRVACLLLTAVLLCGCRPSVLLSQRVILRSVGIDRTKDGFLLTANAYIAVKNGKEGGTTKISGAGETIPDAVEAMTLTTGGQPYFSHNCALVIGKEAARLGIRDILRFFSSYYECRGTAVVYAADRDAATLIDRAGTDPGLAAGLDDLARAGAENGTAAATAVWQAAQALADPDSDFCLPYLMTDGESVFVRGSAVFLDDRFVCLLDEEETRGFLLASGTLSGCRLRVRLSGSTVAFRVSGIRSKISMDTSSGVPDFSVAVSCVCTPADETAGLSETLDRAAAADACSAELTHWVRSAIRTALRTNGADPFSFGLFFRQRRPELWKTFGEDWHSELLRCRYSAQVRVTVR